MNRESQNIEWKEAWHDDYLKWVSGFANAQGGIIVLGKKDDGTPVGLKNARKLLEDLPNKIRDQLGIMAKHPSRPYNPLIADVFFRMGMIEAWGRGIDKIRDVCRTAGLPAPVIRNDMGGIWIEFTLSPQPVLEASEKTSEKKIKTSEKIIALVQENPLITIEDLAVKLGITSRSVERNIEKLKNEGQLRRIGPDNGGKWEIIQ